MELKGSYWLSKSGDVAGSECMMSTLRQSGWVNYKTGDYYVHVRTLLGSGNALCGLIQVGCIFFSGTTQI